MNKVPRSGASTLARIATNVTPDTYLCIECNITFMATLWRAVARSPQRDFAANRKSCEKSRMHDALVQVEGLRERKRRQTLQRIAAVGLELFLAKGYEATTLDDITAAADISRRTFFYYFKSKDDILLAHLVGYARSLKASVLSRSSAGAPIDVAREALLGTTTQFQSPQTLAIARLIQESAVLAPGRTQAIFSLKKH